MNTAGEILFSNDSGSTVEELLSNGTTVPLGAGTLASFGRP